MHEIDLIPADYRVMILRKHWIRLFTIIVSALLLVSASAYAAIGYVTQKNKSDIERLQVQKTISTQQQNELSLLRDKKSELQQQWKLLNGLRSGAAAETMLEMIDRTLPGNDVWFLVWHFKRAGIVVEEPPATVNTGYFIVIPKGEGAVKPQAWQIQTHMTIKGQARDHAALSEFVKQLFQQSEVQDVRIVKTVLRQYAAASVVDFDLAIVVNSSVETT